MAKAYDAAIGPSIRDLKAYSKAVALTPFGNGTGQEIEDTRHFRFHQWQIDARDITGTLKVRIEATIDGETWFNVAADGADTEYTTAGVYLLERSDIRPLKMRPHIVQSGGADVTFSYQGGN